MQSNLPAPWRCCRLQLLAFVLLHLLGSCSRPAPLVGGERPLVTPPACIAIGPITGQQAAPCLPA